MQCICFALCDYETTVDEVRFCEIIFDNEVSEKKYPIDQNLLLIE